ncbi:hypothetical protein LIA77_04965 [Sarocladium implicatum]|nr:hypothetical protein LIA77_04965 [Sarocladium implicatum]
MTLQMLLLTASLLSLRGIWVTKPRIQEHVLVFSSLIPHPALDHHCHPFTTSHRDYLSRFTKNMENISNSSSASNDTSASNNRNTTSVNSKPVLLNTHISYQHSRVNSLMADEPDLYSAAAAQRARVWCAGTTRDMAMTTFACQGCFHPRCSQCTVFERPAQSSQDTEVPKG